MNTVYLDPKMVPQTLRGTYRGRKFQAQVGLDVRLPADMGLWSGGSRDEYSMVRLEDGKTVQWPGQDTGPWDNNRKDRTVTLVPGVCVVRHSMFQGHDLGLTFYLHPDNATKFLPAPAAQLTPNEQEILFIFKTLKSTGRRSEASCYSDAEYNAIVDSLKSKGYLNKAGAVTTLGKNSVGD